MDYTKLSKNIMCKSVQLQMIYTAYMQLLYISLSLVVQANL